MIIKVKEFNGILHVSNIPFWYFLHSIKIFNIKIIKIKVINVHIHIEHVYQLLVNY